MTQAPGRDMWPHEKRLYEFMSAHRGEILTEDQLVSALYPNPDNEPETGNVVMRVMMHYLRRRFGVNIEYVRGWRLPK